MQWEPVNRDSARTASKAAFGQYVDAQYKLENADLILSLDADFLSGIAHPGFLPMSRRLRRAAPLQRRQHHEPDVRGRDDADGDRLQGGAPAGASGRARSATFAQALATGTAPAGFSPEQQKFFNTLLRRPEEPRVKRPW